MCRKYSKCTIFTKNISYSQCETRFLATNLQNKIHRLAVTAKKFHSKSTFLLAKLISFT